MSWRLEFRPEVVDDVADAAAWYEAREAELGESFTDDIFRTWEMIAESPLIGSRRHPLLDVRWRYASRFPYRVIYSVDESAGTILVVAVLHAARQNLEWQERTDSGPN